ncbi:hypothetical protein CN918_31745 [Priestia megaterium]|nr:hypothetical protein CN918_31745 [Priestia megaterium]
MFFLMSKEFSVIFYGYNTLKKGSDSMNGTGGNSNFKGTIEIVKGKIKSRSTKQQELEMEKKSDKEIAEQLLLTDFAKVVKEAENSGDPLSEREIIDRLRNLIREVKSIEEL